MATIYNRDELTMEMYNKLLFNKDTNPNGIFHELREIFLFAAVLGYSEGKKKKLTKRYPLPRGVMDNSRYQNVFKFIALAETKDPTVLIANESRNNELKIIIEEYSNAGIYELEKHILNKKGQNITQAFESLIYFYKDLNKNSFIEDLF
ncbi:MAG: hypothetical protein ACRCZ9_06165 [Fusobacteriaceae bacterium]